MTDNYQYFRPQTLDHAFQFKADHPDARFIAGGTDLLVQMRKRVAAAPDALISLRSIPELTAIVKDDDRFTIGAMTTVSEIIANSTLRTECPALIQASLALGSDQIRNVATVGGNLVNASPAADLAPPLLVYDASVKAVDAKGSRDIPLCDFFTGPGQTALQPGEVLHSITLPRPGTGVRSAFMRRGRVKMDLAAVSVAVFLELDGKCCVTARVAAGAVAPTPLRLREVESLLEGEGLTPELLVKAQELAAQSVSPITDIRSNAEYRRHLVGVFTRRCIESLLAE